MGHFVPGGFIGQPLTVAGYGLAWGPRNLLNSTRHRQVGAVLRQRLSRREPSPAFDRLRRHGELQGDLAEWGDTGPEGAPAAAAGEVDQRRRARPVSSRSQPSGAVGRQSDGPLWVDCGRDGADVPAAEWRQAPPVPISLPTDGYQS